jgi:hypothetical protein
MKNLTRGIALTALSLALCNCQKTHHNAKGVANTAASQQEIVARKIINEDSINMADLNTAKDFLKGEWTSDSCQAVTRKVSESKSEIVFRMGLRFSNDGDFFNSSSKRFSNGECKGSTNVTYAVNDASIRLKNVSTKAVSLSKELKDFVVYTIRVGKSGQSDAFYALLAIPNSKDSVRVLHMTLPVDSIEKLPLVLSEKNTVRFDGK